MEQLTHDLISDTICAVSTPHGKGGIAVVRVSGPDALPTVMKSWKGANLAAAPSHTLHFGRIVYPDGETLDEVVASVFRAPHSFTGEDVVELSCHGSTWVQSQIVALLIANGCRAAEGGEFTRRAFLNRKLDLSQAEAIADVIASSSRAAHRIAVSQMRGGFSRMLSALREKLLEFVSLIELELDFSEEEVEFADRTRLVALAEDINATLSRLADSFAIGNAIKNGIPVAIVGEPNAGKSTLLNRLLHDDKALVSDIRGTTRDAIEDTIDLGGLTFRFIDTAGIRQTDDTIESMGIERTFKKISEAGIVLWMIDATQPLDNIPAVAADILPRTKGKTLIAVVNKIDRLDPDTLASVHKAIEKATPSTRAAFISAKCDIDVDRLEQMLLKAAQIPDNDPDAVVVANARHYDALVHARDAIQRAIAGLKAGISGDFAAQDIRECMHYLGEITGEITTDEVLGSIFSRFCIGK
ncbi:MAG TPA: tRNA uridine-5-carboxymethylaminomethyl(34) synthesis GTPase MnmE [Candidatus Limisoma intestinavium]|uniref:tRNA modification GTPase MnmE n=1 Tax=Candidatus Limisoma intestinavium TaxID=2840856 RepID=A0A9D1ILB7_9BACT|nr:tRNA uridine-5-carboxymethylaminomethyl(34) synthesis GTPase MnmE [Candidatus Limisoma intestinavium]